MAFDSNIPLCLSVILQQYKRGKTSANSPINIRYVVYILGLVNIRHQNLSGHLKPSRVLSAKLEKRFSWTTCADRVFLSKVSQSHLVPKWQNHNLECYCHEPHCPYWVAQSKLSWQPTLKQLVKCLSCFALPGSLWMIYESVACVSINVAMKFCTLNVTHCVKLWGTRCLCVWLSVHVRVQHYCLLLLWLGLLHFMWKDGKEGSSDLFIYKQ